ncbi:MAG: hypothetical protein V5A22_04920, partial [Salinivenus sp.]
LVGGQLQDEVLQRLCVVGSGLADGCHDEVDIERAKQVTTTMTEVVVAFPASEPKTIRALELKKPSSVFTLCVWRSIIKT